MIESGKVYYTMRT